MSIKLFLYYFCCLCIVYLLWLYSLRFIHMHYVYVTNKNVNEMTMTTKKTQSYNFLLHIQDNLTTSQCRIKSKLTYESWWRLSLRSMLMVRQFRVPTCPIIWWCNGPWGLGPSKTKIQAVGLAPPRPN